MPHAGAHDGCATYLASMAARGARLGARARPIERPAGASPGHDRHRGCRRPALAGPRARARPRSLAARSRRSSSSSTLLVLAISGLRGGVGRRVADREPDPRRAPRRRPPRRRPRRRAPRSRGHADGGAVDAAPSPTPAKPTTVPTPTFRTYTVKSGDTLSGIAAKFDTTSRAIARPERDLGDDSIAPRRAGPEDPEP